MKKEILLIGAVHKNQHIYSYATSFKTAFEQLGYNVSLFNYRSRKNTLLRNWKKNYDLRRYSAQLNPTMSFLLKTESLEFQTYLALRKHSRYMVGFHPDNPFCLWNYNSSAALVKALPLFDCYTSWSSTLQQHL